MPRSPEAELAHNTGLVADPAHLAREHGAASWLYLRGEEFAAMDGGMSYADVQSAVEVSANVVSDPPRVLDMDLARCRIAAQDDLPRPTLVTCRTGARSSALIYLYEGLRAGEPADQVLGRAESDGAPSVDRAECREWVQQGLPELPGDGNPGSSTVA